VDEEELDVDKGEDDEEEEEEEEEEEVVLFSTISIFLA
jgi:hypothetical protein